jgi:iron complex outermembrane receptor protein
MSKSSFAATENTTSSRNSFALRFGKNAKKFEKGGRAKSYSLVCHSMTLSPPVARRSLLVVFVGLILAVSVAVAAPVKFDIPAQPAPSALEAFTKQSGADVMFSQSALAKKQSTEVKGEMEPDAALAQLLAGTGFTYTREGETKFMISAAESARVGSIDGSVREEKSGRPVGGAQVQVRGTDKVVTTDKRGRFSIEGVPAGTHILLISATGMQNTHVTDVEIRSGGRLSLSPVGLPVKQEGPIQLEPYSVSAKKNDGVVELDPYSVDGRREKAFSSASIDLTRTRDDVLPFTTFSARDIELSGALNLEDFLRRQLVQNFSASVPEESNGDLGTAQNGAFAGSTANEVNFRGWGATTESVILVNGRRLPTRSAAANSAAGDFQGNFRGIPINSIERIEVLTSAGSAIYGAGATGGVLNIITKKGHQGGQLALGVAGPLSASAPKWTTDIDYAMPLGSRSVIRVVGSWSESSPLEVGDRSDVMAARWRSVLFAREPSRIVSGTGAVPLGATPNIRTDSTSSSANLFGPGTPNFTSVPDGYAGGQGLAPFLSRQGVYNLALAEGGADATFSRQANLQPKVVNKSVTLGVDYEASRLATLSLDYSYTDTASEADGTNYMELPVRSLGLLVPESVPNNPFGAPVWVNFDDPRLNRPGMQRRLNEISHNLVGSARAELGNWRGIVDLSLTRVENEVKLDHYHAPVGGWLNALTSGAYNPFVDMRVTPPASAAFYSGDFVMARRKFIAATDSALATAKVSGPVFELLTGKVNLTAGVEWLRNKRTRGDNYADYVNSGTGLTAPRISTENFGQDSRSVGSINTYRTRYSNDSRSIYAETSIPLASERQQIPFLTSLEVFASGRASEEVLSGYHPSTGAPIEYETNPYLHSIGVRWDSGKGLVLRASKSIGFKPPTYAQVTPDEPPTFSTSVFDPRRNQFAPLSSSQFVTGGNQDLEPESSEAINFGLVIQPRSRAFRVAVDYLESTRDNAVTSLDRQEVVDLELDPLMHGRVRRASAEPNAPGGVGVITFVDARNINFRQIIVRSVDATLNYSIENVLGGRITFLAAATKNLSFKLQTTNSAPAVEQVRNPTAALSRQLKWNANSQIRWERDRILLSWSARYYDDVLAAPADQMVLGSYRASSEIEHDISASYRFSPKTRQTAACWLLDDVVVSVGARNLFDREPRFWVANTGRGIVPFDSYAGRTIWFTYRKNL